MPTNEMEVANAEVALRSFCENANFEDLGELGKPELQERLTDLVASLHHYAAHKGLDMDQASVMGAVHASKELGR